MRGGGRSSSHLPRPSYPSSSSPQHLLPAARPPPLLLCVCLLIIIITGSHAQCPLGVGHDGKCYVMQTGTNSWSDARALCAQLSGTLPVVNDDVTQEVITRLMKEEGAASIWLGAKGETGDWHWASSGEVIGPQGCFLDSPWSPALEEVQTISDMTPGRCMDTCRQEGATYAAIQSKVHCHCGDSYTYGQGGLTGCTIPCPGDNQQYCGGWGKNSVYTVNGVYGGWSYSQPDGANDACAVMDTSGNNRKFADEACFRIKPYICDIPMSSCRAPDVGYYVTAGVCLYVGSDMTWWEARSACKERDGTLLVVKNTSHHNVIRRLLNGTGIDGAHWIGLTRSSWTWSDQGTLSWTGWASRSPSGQSGRCLSVTSSSGFKWVDSGCGEQLRTVCALAAPSTTTEPPTSPIPTTTSFYPSPTTLNLPVQTTELPTQSDSTSLNSTLPGPSTASGLTTLEHTLEQTTLTSSSTTTEPLGEHSLEFTTVVTEESSTKQFTSTMGIPITSTQHISTDNPLAESTPQSLASSTIDQGTTGESSTEIPDSNTEMTISSSQGDSTESPLEITTGNLTTELMTSEHGETTTVLSLSSTEIPDSNTEMTIPSSQGDYTEGTIEITTGPLTTEVVTSELGETTTVLSLLSTDNDISQYFTTPIAEEHNDVSSTENVEFMTSQVEETTSQPPKDLSTLPDGDILNHTQSGLTTTEPITTWLTNTPSGQTKGVEELSTGTPNFHLETAESTAEPASTTVPPPSSTSTNYPVNSSTNNTLYQSTTDGGLKEMSSASNIDDISTQSVPMSGISVTTPTYSTTEESISSKTTQDITINGRTTQDNGTTGSSRPYEHTSTASIIAETALPSTEKAEKQSTEILDDTTTISKILTSRQEPGSPTTDATSAATTTATTSTTTEEELQEETTSNKFETTSASQTGAISNLAGTSTPTSQMSSAGTSLPFSVTKSFILSTLASSTLRYPTRNNKTPVDDVTTGIAGVDLTSTSDVNSTSSSEVPAEAKDDDDGGWSPFEIGVVAVLVALALGLATSMVVFLSCKKRGGGSCRKKSNKTESVQAANDIFTAGGATSGHVTLGNGSIQNGGSHGPVGNGLSEKQRRKSEQYSLDVTAEAKDLTTMEDISVGIIDAKRGKKQKSKRNGSLINGGSGMRGSNGPGPPSTWGTIPKYYYGMDKYNGAYAGGYYGNQEGPDPELMQRPLPLRQEVFFRMSQVFADPHQGVPNPDNQQHSALGVGGSRPSDSTMASAPPICVLDANGLNYEASSMYYDAFDPEQNTYSSTFPRYPRNETPNGGTANGVVSQEPVGPERSRLYEPSGQARHYGQPNYYEKKKSARVPPRTKVPLDGDDESVVGRQDSFSSHCSFTDDTMSSTTSPHRSPVMNRAMERSRSDASRHLSQSDSRHSPVSENTVGIPSASIHGSQTGSLHRKPRIADVVIPVPPRLPGASQPPPPPKRSPPAPPPRRSSTSTNDIIAIYAQPNGQLKQNGLQPELQRDGRKVFRLNAAEEGITWC